MKIKTFWTIFLKILGIWLLMSSATVIVQLFGNIYYEHASGDSDDMVLYIIVFIIIAALYFLVLKLLFYKTDWIIDKLHLDKGFNEESIDLNVKFSTVLTVAIIVFAGLMLIESLPILCTRLFEFFQQQVAIRKYSSTGIVLFHLVKIVVAYWLLTNATRVANFVEKKVFKDKDETQ